MRSFDPLRVNITAPFGFGARIQAKQCDGNTRSETHDDGPKQGALLWLDVANGDHKRGKVSEQLNFAQAYARTYGHARRHGRWRPR